MYIVFTKPIISNTSVGLDPFNYWSYLVPSQGIWNRMDAATGITEDKIKNMSPAKAYTAAVLLSVILSFYLYINVMIGGPDDMRHGQELFMTFKHGAAHGAFLAIFVAFPVLATNAIFEMKSAKYIFINVFYWMVSLALMGGALNGWPV